MPWSEENIIKQTILTKNNMKSYNHSSQKTFWHVYIYIDIYIVLLWCPAYKMQTSISKAK